jgi:hypothetical protein
MQGEAHRPSWSCGWWLGISTVLYLSMHALYATRGIEAVAGEYLFRFLFLIIIAWWVERDAASRGEYFPGDWCILFSWLFVPFYLIRTRKWIGLAWMIAIVAFWIGTFYLMTGLHHFLSPNHGLLHH